MNREWTKQPKGDGGGDYNDVTWKCEDQPELEGTLTSVKHNVGRHDQTVYSIEDESGQAFTVWDTAVLKNLLSEVEEGAYIKIVYLGKKAGKSGTKYKDFDVFIDHGGAPATEEAPVVVEEETEVETEVEETEVEETKDEAPKKALKVDPAPEETEEVEEKPKAKKAPVKKEAKKEEEPSEDDEEEEEVPF